MQTTYTPKPTKQNPNPQPLTITVPATVFKRQGVTVTVKPNEKKEPPRPQTPGAKK